MKLITWNIQFGVGVDGRNDLERIIAEARRIADFDVLCLQEVADNFPELKDNRGEDQFAEIARLLPGYTAVDGTAVDVPLGDAQRPFDEQTVTAKFRELAEPVIGAGGAGKVIALVETLDTLPTLDPLMQALKRA